MPMSQHACMTYSASTSMFTPIYVVLCLLVRFCRCHDHDLDLDRGIIGSGRATIAEIRSAHTHTYLSTNQPVYHSPICLPAYLPIGTIAPRPC